jgi:molybdate transport system substrate-binding protein
MLWLYRVCGLGLCVLAGCGAPPREGITVYAAASTRAALQEIAAEYQAQTGNAVVLNAGPSSTLARQIAQGGRADLFLSADERWADYLAEKDLVADRRDLLTNRLVVIVPAESTLRLADLAVLDGPEVTRLALAGPEVPAGRYAREALARAGVWDRVRGRVLEGGDVRAALTYVARGEAEAGIVYASDVVDNPRVRVAFEVPAALHTPIRYPLVRIRGTPREASAQAFAANLASPEAAACFRRYGFGIVADGGRRLDVLNIQAPQRLE